MTDNYQTAPDNLPVPQDDGACSHLIGRMLPDIELLSTSGYRVNLSVLPGQLVIYCYPKTGKPGVSLPEGWDDIPGARGCTPQSCSFRDHYAQLTALSAEVFGLSTQATDYQKEMVERLQLPFNVLSDNSLLFSKALSLPTFDVDDERLIKRLTLIVKDGVIKAVHYPVFPSDSDPSWVIDYLEKQ